MGHGRAKQTVRPDIAFVVVEPGVGDGSGGFDLLGAPEAVTASERAKLRAQLRRLDIAPSAVQFDTAPFGLGDTQGTTVRVEVPVSRLRELASNVAQAVTGVIGNQTTSGLRFAVSDCPAALTTARTAALADARRHARALAGAAHVALGELLAVSEGSTDSASAAYAAALRTGEPCGRESAESSSALSRYGPGTGLLPLDAKPEVELTFEVSASYALGKPADQTMTATGDGSAQGRADTADILLGNSFDGGFSGEPHKITTEERDRIIAGVRAFGIADNDIEVDAQASGILTYVRVHLPVTRLRASGTKIVAAVKNVIGSEADAGVIFTASNCDDLVQQAREKAAADAGKRLTRLARAAQVQVGPIVGLDEPSLASFLPAQVDPCHFDFETLDSSEGLISLATSIGGGLGGVSLQPIDAEPRVRQHVIVSETRAITG